MTGFSRDQLEALRRQIEEDYRFDVAAIDRLLRRFSAQGAPAPMYASGPTGTPLGAPVAEMAPPAPLPAAPAYSPVLAAAPMPASIVETSSPAPLPPAAQEQQPDELAGSIRAMFASYRK